MSYHTFVTSRSTQSREILVVRRTRWRVESGRASEGVWSSEVRDVREAEHPFRARLRNVDAFTVLFPASYGSIGQTTAVHVLRSMIYLPDVEPLCQSAFVS